MYGKTLSVRRSEMAVQLEKTANQRAADFDYRRRIIDDIEDMMRGADVFKPRGGEPSAAALHEQNALLRRLAEDIASYIIK
jgi:cob(I)alamin adenosyltransferase